MIILMNNETGLIHKFFVVDFHHHIGNDDDGNKSFPTDTMGTYSFCRQILQGNSERLGLEKELNQNRDNYLWSPVDDKILDYYSYDSYFEKLDTSFQKDFMHQTLSIDRIVVFPMHDTYRFGEDGEPEFKPSNDEIHDWTTKYPHSLKLSGFARVNPDDGAKAIEELKRAILDCGLVGLKLHPKAEKFRIDTDNVVNLLVESANLNVPVIFHTDPYTTYLEMIYAATNKAINILVEQGKSKLISQLKVVIGHCTYDSEEAFKALNHPNIYGEMSLQKDIMGYLQKAKENITYEITINKIIPDIALKIGKSNEYTIDLYTRHYLTKTKWFHKLLFGSDYPFQPVSRSIDAIISLFSKDDRISLNPEEINYILGLNALRLLPMAKVSKRTIMNPSFGDFQQHLNYIDSLRNQNSNIISIEPILYDSSILAAHNSCLLLSENEDKTRITMLYRTKLKSLSSGKIINYEKIEEKDFVPKRKKDADSVSYIEEIEDRL